MLRYAFIAMAALAMTGCGSDDPETKPKCEVGDEGCDKLPEGPVPAEILITTEAGRSFTTRPVHIAVIEQSEADPRIAVHFIGVEAATGTDFDLQFLLSSEQLIKGKANPNLSATSPSGAGFGKIEVQGPDVSVISNPSTDKLDVLLNKGHLTGTVGSPNPELAATIKGSYLLSCLALEGTLLVDDADFTTEFCAQYADQREPAEEEAL